mmetsp:Transcript_129330/g.374517  ORF Transcript_129330/g.374517 Transcript_129330/m.374517 type:complete len:511 (+) Transcript_129330:443-1975(+)
MNAQVLALEAGVAKLRGLGLGQLPADDLPHEVLRPPPANNAPLVLLHEARRVMDHLRRHHLPEEVVASAVDDPHALRQGPGGHRDLNGLALAAPATAARALHAVIVLVLEAALNAGIGAPQGILLTPRVPMALPWRVDLREPMQFRTLLRRPEAMEAIVGEVVPRRHCETAEPRLAGVLAAAVRVATRRGVHPRHGRVIVTPVRDTQAHPLLHRRAEFVQVTLLAPVVVHHDLPALLSQRGHHAQQNTVLLGERGLHLERVPRVDGVRRVWAVGALPVSCVFVATAAVATVVVSVHRRVAFVGCGLEGVVVRFHDVDLRAPLTPHLVSVAIERGLVAAVLSGAEFAALADGGRRDEVHCNVASATDLAQIDSEAERPAQEVELSDAPGLPLLLASRENAHAGVVSDDDFVTGGAAILSGEVGRRHAVDGHGPPHQRRIASGACNAFRGNASWRNASRDDAPRDNAPGENASRGNASWGEEVDAHAAAERTPEPRHRRDVHGGRGRTSAAP